MMLTLEHPAALPEEMLGAFVPIAAGWCAGGDPS